MDKGFQTPQVSIVMPALNCEKYIAQAIRSVQEQTFSDWELLIVDNGSEDGTRSVALDLAAADPRIRVILDCVERCAGVARNRALQSARGEWVAFLDSDDIWLPEKLAVQLETAAEKNSSFLFTASAFMNEDGSEKGYILHVPEQVGYPEILKQDIISCSSVLVKRELLKGSFLETTNAISDDYAAWIRILRDRNISAVGIDRPLLRYRISRTSLSFNKLQSAVRCFRTYRHVGLSLPETLRYWLQYAFRGLRKYTRLYTS